MTYNTTLPGYGDMCFCGSYGPCRCAPEPDVDGYFDASYQAGYEACEADSYDERPMTEWIYVTHHRAFWSDAERRLVYTMTTLRFGELTWRHHHRSAAAYARWFGRTYGHDLDSYLAGFDDCGAGLPSAVNDSERHRLFEQALDAYEPVPDLCDRPLGPWPMRDVEDWLPM